MELIIIQTLRERAISIHCLRINANAYFLNELCVNVNVFLKCTITMHRNITKRPVSLLHTGEHAKTCNTQSHEVTQT